VLEEGRRNLAALVAYLRAPELQRPALAAQRGVEARIGQLGPPHRGVPGHDQELHARRHKSATKPLPDRDLEVDGGTLADFRVLAKALDGKVEITPKEWQKSRRARG